MTKTEFASRLSSLATEIEAAGSDHLKIEALTARLRKEADGLRKAESQAPTIPVTGQAEAEVPEYVLKGDPNAPKGVPVVEKETKTEAIARGDLRPGINDLNAAAELKKGK